MSVYAWTTFLFSSIWREERVFHKRKFLVGGFILGITLIWGYAWVLMKASLQFMGPFAFTSFRFAIGSATLLVIVWLLKQGFPPKKYMKHLMIVGLLQTTAVFLLVMYGLMFVGAGKSSVILYSMPIWSSLLAVKFLEEKLRINQIFGLLIGLIGLFTILGWDIWSGQTLEVIIGELLIVIAAIVWAISNIYFRLHVNELPKVQSTAFQMTFGTIGIFIATLLTEWGEPVQLNLVSIYYIVFAGVFASALCFTGWFFVLSMINMATATIATMLVPVFGLIFSALLLGEEITLGIIVGSSFIIFGIIIAQRKEREQISEKS